MARARFLRPEFFTDEKISELPFGARLLFQVCWCHADLNGVFEYSVKQLRALGFPYDEGLSSATVGEWCEQLVTLGLIVRFESNGKSWAFVKNWDKHQSINTREKQIGSRNPLPPGGQVLNRVDPVSDPGHADVEQSACLLTPALNSSSSASVGSETTRTRSDKVRRFLEGLGAKTRKGQEDLITEWEAALKGMKNKRIEEIFAGAKPGIIWPSQFLQWRAAQGSY